MGHKGRRTRPGGNPELRRQLQWWAGAGAHGPWGFTIPGQLLRTYQHLLDRSDKYATAPYDSRAKLAEDLELHPATVTRHIAALEALGMLEVVRAPIVPRQGRKAPPGLPRGAKHSDLWKRAFTNRYRFCRPKTEAAGERPSRTIDQADAHGPAAAPRPPRVQLVLLDDVDQVDGDRAPPTDPLAAAHRLEQLRAALPSR